MQPQYDAGHSRLLPRICEASGGELPIPFDGGIRRGTDVWKAIALGASAVLVGRPYVYGLANAGAMRLRRTGSNFLDYAVQAVGQ